MKLKNFALLLIAGFTMQGNGKISQSAPNELWYRQPASQWTAALPIGNGRIGAMIFGNPAQEHLQFNEETLWDSYPREYQREGAYKFLPEIRKLLSDGKQAEAERNCHQSAKE